MNKLFLTCGIFIMLACAIGVVLNNATEDVYSSDLDKRFNIIADELKDYDGAMIVKYDMETGEIISKRKAYAPTEAGILVVTEKEYLENKNKIPDGTLIIPDTFSPLDVIEVIN